jgi:pimeloyl-ACP methyl ester carboxylesterase
VHAGFGEAFLRVWPELDNTLRTFEREGGKRLWLAGHSLGGALAFLCAAAVSLAAPPFQWLHMTGLYTYGQPRTGDPSFIECVAAQMEADYFRVVHGSDIVPHVPPAFLTAGFPGVRPSGKKDDADYAHGGTLVYLPPGTGPVEASMPQRTPPSLKQILLRMMPAIRQSPGVVIDGRNIFSKVPKEILHHFLRGTKPEHTAYISRLRSLWPALNS